MKFVKIPNLPENAASVLVSGELCAESEKTLNALGVHAVKTAAEPILYDAVKYHPDMQFCHLGDEYAVCTAGAAKALPRDMRLCIRDIPDGKYPGDIYYNAARVGNFMLCNSSHTSPEILRYCRENGICVIDAAQGYAKCNVCVIDEGAVITSDAGIARACAKYPIDVLTVDDKNVRLAGFAHGFFGGATGKLRRDLLAVNGNLDLHKNAAEIRRFARRHDVDIISLSSEPVTDIGTIIPLEEK